MLCGAALRNKGVQPLLDAVVDYLPSPLDVPPVEGVDPTEDEPLLRGAAATTSPSRRSPSRSRPTRSSASSLLPRLLGLLKAGEHVYNSTKDKRERIGRIVLLHANHREDIEFGLGRRHRRRGRAQGRPFTGDTLSDPDKPIVLETIKFPEPVIHIAIEPKTKADQEKMGLALARLAEEDPTFRVRTDPETGQTLICGMGELHLEVIVDRMLPRVQSGRERRSAAGRLPRDDHPGRRRPRAAS